MIKTRLVGLLSHAKKYIVYTILWQWLALFSQIAAVFTIAGLIEAAVNHSIDAARVQRAALILVAVVLVRLLCEKMGAKSSYMACVDVKRVLREKIYDKLLRLGASYRDLVSTAEIVQVSTEGVEQLETYFGKYLPQLFYSLLAPVTLFIVLCRVNLKASVVLLICVPLIPISIVVVQKIAKKLLNKYWSVYTGLGDSFLENLMGLTTLKIYQADGQKADEMDAESQRFRKITMKVLTMQLNSTSVMDIVAYGGAAVGMVVALSEFANGALSVSGTLSIILLASEFFLPLRLLGSFFHIAMNGMAASDKIFRILDMEEPDDGGSVLPDGALDIEFSDVHFSYGSGGLDGNRVAQSETDDKTGAQRADFGNTSDADGGARNTEDKKTMGVTYGDTDSNREILKGINLSLPAGHFISLVGESGCGKSTIAGILSGRNKGYAGSVTIGGMELSDINETDIMKHVVLVRHNSYLFAGTVADNLRMAKRNATDEEMWNVLEKVNLKDFIASEDGLDTVIQEKAGNLSGGQSQRLGIARALLADAPVYIFDEATSNIDADSEEIIMNVIHEMAQTKTILLISHRLANVTGSDKIYMLKDGAIAESGTHDELMKFDGSYRHLYERQMALENYGGRMSEKAASERLNLEKAASKKVDSDKTTSDSLDKEVQR